MITFEIPGVPIPWKRPGHNFKTKAIYDQQKLLKEQLRWYMRTRYKEEPLKVPVDVDFTFYLPMPKNASGPRKREMLNGVLHHMCRPDADNLAKFYLDVMTGVIYDDDGQVCHLGSDKFYASEPYTLIEIKPKTCDMKKQTEVKELKEVSDNEDDPRVS